jgi:peptidoglycan/LPS O-acetylase OafA/YrhL
MNNKISRNNTIEFWRFAFICAIGVMHFSNSYFGNALYFDDAYVATEFFFIVSGYFLLQSYEKRNKNKKGAWNYTINKVYKLYPFYLLSFLLIFVLTMIQEGAGIKEWAFNLGGSVWELLFLQISGLKCFRLFNYPTWYISAMLIAGYFIYVGLELWEEKFVKLVMPFGVLFIYCFFSKENGNMDVWGGAAILKISDAIMRAFAGMCLGGICFRASKWLSLVEFSKIRQILMSVLELIAYILGLVLMSQKAHTQLDFYIIGLLAVAVTITGSGRTMTYKLFQHSGIAYLGKISYPMFLNQIFVIKLMGMYFLGLGYYKGVLFFIVFLAVISFIEMIAVGCFVKIWNKRIRVK